MITFGNAASSHSGLIPVKTVYKKRGELLWANSAGIDCPVLNGLVTFNILCIKLSKLCCGCHCFFPFALLLVWFCFRTFHFSLNSCTIFTSHKTEKMCKSNLVEGLEGPSGTTCVLKGTGTATPPVAGVIGFPGGKAFGKSFKFGNGCPTSPGE